MQSTENRGENFTVVIGKVKKFAEQPLVAASMESLNDPDQELKILVCKL